MCHPSSPTMQPLGSRASKGSFGPARSRPTQVDSSCMCCPDLATVRSTRSGSTRSWRLIAGLRRRGYSGATISAVLIPLSRLFAHAASRDLIEVNPITKLDRTERPRVSRRERPVLNRDEIGRLLEAAARATGRSSRQRSSVAFDRANSSAFTGRHRLRRRGDPRSERARPATQEMYRRRLARFARGRPRCPLSLRRSNGIAAESLFRAPTTMSLPRRSARPCTGRISPPERSSPRSRRQGSSRSAGTTSATPSPACSSPAAPTSPSSPANSATARARSPSASTHTSSTAKSKPSGRARCCRRCSGASSSGSAVAPPTEGSR